MFEELKALEAKNIRPKLLLHLCCAPCSSYVIELLDGYFDLLLYFYDPNIHPKKEYEKRRDEAREHADRKGLAFVEGPYDVKKWHALVEGHEGDSERGERCRLCYDMRMSEAARFARDNECQYFTTVLSISPHKDAGKINEIGYQLEGRYELKYLPADFKKKEGYKKSIELSKEYGLFRQDYCGCVYSKR